MKYIQKDLRKNHRYLYDLLLALNKTDEKPLNVCFLPEKKANYLLSVISDPSQRSFILVRYNDETEIKPEGEENIKTVEVLSFSSTSLAVNKVLGYLSVIIDEYSASNQVMIMIRRNDSGSIFIEHLRRIYSDNENTRFFPTARYSESGEDVINRLGHGWKQTKTEEELCRSCMRDALTCQYFLLSTDLSDNCFELLRYAAPNEKDSKDNFWMTWGMISFVRHNRLKIFLDDDIDPQQYEVDQYNAKVSRSLRGRILSSI